MHFFYIHYVETSVLILQMSLKERTKYLLSNYLLSSQGELYETNNYMNEAHEELWRSRRVLSVEAVGRGG